LITFIHKVRESLAAYCGAKAKLASQLTDCLEFNVILFLKEKSMSKLIAALIAGLFAVSVNAFAADAKPAAETAPAAK
jgi:hypothetical protein